MSNIGKASIEITADGKRFSQSVRQQVLPGLSQMGTHARASADTLVRSWGSSLGRTIPRVQELGAKMLEVGPKVESVGRSLTKGVTMPAVGAATAVAGVAVAGGWKRLVGIDTARGQFKGLGLDADAVMKQVDKGVTDTSLSMAQGASLAVSAMATGNLPLKDLESQIKRVANVSAAYGVEAEHAGYLFNNILTKNKVTWGDLSQMQMNNIPIVTALGDHFGVTGEKIQKMAQDGEISIDDLNQAIDAKAGKAAEEYAKTWEGVSANIMSNLGKVGAKFMEPTFEILKDKAADLLEFLRSDELSAWAEKWGQRIGEAVGTAVEWVSKVIDWFQNLDGWQQKVVLSIAGFVVALGPVLMIAGKVTTVIGKLITSPLGKQLTKWATVAARMAGAHGLGGIVSVAGRVLSVFLRFNLIGAILTTVVVAIKGVWDRSEAFRDAVDRLWETVKEAVTQIGDKFGEVFGAIGELFNSLGGDGPVATFIDLILNGLGPVFAFLVDIVSAAVNNVVGFITGLLDVIIGVVELVTAVFNGDWNAAWEAVKKIVLGAVQAVWNGVQLWFVGRLLGVVRGFGGTLRNIWTSLWNGIRSLFTTVVNGIRTVASNVFNAIRSTISTILNAIRSVFSTVWNGIRSFVTTIINGIRSTISNVFNGIRSTVTSIMNGIRSTFSNIWNAIRNLFSSAVNGVRNTVSSGFNNIVNFVRGLPGRLLSALGRIGSLFTNAGSSLINGFLGGIQRAWGRVTSFVRNGLQGLRNLLPFSPAKEGPFSGKGYTLYSGQALIGDFAEGIRRQEGGLVDSMRDAAERAQSAFSIDAQVPNLTGVNVSSSAPAIRGMARLNPPPVLGSFNDRGSSSNSAQGGFGDVIQVIVPRGRDRVAVLQGLESARFRQRVRSRNAG